MVVCSIIHFFAGHCVGCPSIYGILLPLWYLWDILANI